MYVLFEHKSYPEPRIAFHLLRYMVRIWEQALKQGVLGELPPIIPIVAYHGKAKWKIALDLRALFASPEELTAFLPDFRYVLCDFSRFSDDAIKGMVTLRVALLLMKYIFREDLGERLPEILGLLQELEKKRSGLEYLETVLRYLAHGTDKINAEDLRKAVETALPETGGTVMPTIAEKWIEQGIQQGIQQGTLQGIQQGILQTAREDIIEILEVRFEVVTRTIVERINGIDDPTILKMLLKKAATVGSLEEFVEVMDRIMGQLSNEGTYRRVPFQNLAILACETRVTRNRPYVS